MLPDADLRFLVYIGAGYVAVRFLEAYGLWCELAWGEWLGALSAGLYIPFEVRHLLHRPSIVSTVILAGNVFVVAFLAFQLWRRRGGVKP